MKKLLIILGVIACLSGISAAQFTFYLIDNFEDGNISAGPKWWQFGGIKAEVVKNAAVEKRDLIAESCGDYSLKLVGSTQDWYIGGIGSDLGVDAQTFARFQIDIDGTNDSSGTLKIELFDDDNLNYSIEQDPQHDYDPVYDDRFVAEIKVQGEGFTRISIPFTAFKDTNPGVGDDIWNPNQEDGSGGLLKMQLVAIGQTKVSSVDFNIDNLLLTY
ncbi:MAG: hypothetical protein ABH823_03455 [bacterium]